MCLLLPAKPVKYWTRPTALFTLASWPGREIVKEMKCNYLYSQASRPKCHKGLQELIWSKSIYLSMNYVIVIIPIGDPDNHWEVKDHYGGSNVFRDRYDNFQCYNMDVSQIDGSVLYMDVSIDVRKTENDRKHLIIVQWSTEIEPRSSSCGPN